MPATKMKVGYSVRYRGEVGTVKEIDEDGDVLIEVPSRVYPLWVPVENVYHVRVPGVCYHPDHSDDHDCSDRAVGCSDDCSCCSGIEA